MSKKNKGSKEVVAIQEDVDGVEMEESTQTESAIAACISVTKDTVSIGIFSAPMAEVLQLTAKNKALGPFDVIAARYFRAKTVKVVCEDEDAKLIVDSYDLIPNTHISSVSVGAPVREKAERITTKDLIETFPGRKFTRINLGAAEALEIAICNTVDEVNASEVNCWYKGYLIRK